MQGKTTEPETKVLEATWDAAPRPKSAAGPSVAPVATSFSPHPVHSMQGILGNLVTRRALTLGMLQPKLTIGALDDVYEKEADEVAEKVMSQQAPRSEAGESGSEDDRNNGGHSTGRLASQDSAQRSILQRVPIQTLQQTLGNRAFGRLLRQNALTASDPQVSKKCACGGESKEECAECSNKRIALRRNSAGVDSASLEAPSIVEDVLATHGHPLAQSARTALEPSFGYDFGDVRVHNDSRAADSAAAVDALAYTVGNHIVFGAGRYAPGTSDGNRLLAHELTHVVQQGGVGGQIHASRSLIQRACLPAASCAAPPGSAATFGTHVQSAEAAARARRAAMSPVRQVATGHTGHARALETFFNSQAPGLLANIHGIFVDQDMDVGVEASTQDCDTMVPPIRGATKPCVFVHGSLNQEAFAFNTDPTATTIGGRPREDWRIATLQTLTHEVQHVRYDTTVGVAAAPAGTTCARVDIESELSELNAILSEFPAVFDAVPAGAPPGDPARTRLAAWFRSSITNTGESIQGNLKGIDCKCSCADTDTYVKETVAFVTSAWSVAQKDALNDELRRPVWALRWPL